uniref:Thiol:disulfide interchange protein n=1 Tax=Laurencieae sp. TaxID=2007162 RepID=A0A1Z1M211_9FLOR|nr:thiol:disulfide interchange protein [Laurencieae sp.]
MFYLSNLLDQYQIFLYLLYQNTYHFFFANYNSINFVFLIIVFLMGVFTVLTPCFISMFPILITYANLNKSQIFNTTLFIVGVISSTIFIVLLSNFINLYSFFYKLPGLSSLILILVSLNLMQVLNFSFISKLFYSRLDKASNLNMNLQSYFIGILIGISSTPCSTSIILIFTFLLKHIDNIFYLSLYCFVYLLGSFLILLIILNVKINYNKFYLLALLWNLIFPLGGSLMFVFSLLSLLRWSFL